MTLRALTPKFAMFAAPRRVLFAASEHVPRHLSRAQRLAPRLYSTEADASSKTDDAKASNGEATATANATGNKAAAPKQAPRSSRTTSYSSGSRNSSSYKAGASSRKLASYSKPAAPSEPAQQADLEDSSESRPPRQSIYTPNLAQYDPPDKLPEDCTASSQVDWANSFFGISVQPATHKQFKQLSQPVHIEDIEVKPDGVIYLPEIKYRRKLNEVFGPMGWGLIPKGEPVVGSNIVTREYALIINGRFVSQAQGENNFFSDDQLPSAVEGCKSNALMRCCKDLGISSELWDPIFVRWFKKNHTEQVWVEHMTTKKKKSFWFKKGEVDVPYPYKLA